MPSPGIHDLARALTRDAFAKAFGNFFLVVTDTGDDEPPSSFETVDASSASRISDVVPRGIEAHPIAKAKGNPYQDRISLGRATNCDVVLRYSTVSKLHGYFSARAGHVGEDPQTPAGLDFVDVGSQVGSRVNGRVLVANVPVPVTPGALLVIGRVVVRFVGAAVLWDLFKAQQRLDSA